MKKMKIKTLILFVLFTTLSKGLTITGDISIGMGLNLGANTLEKPMLHVKTIASLTLPKNYEYFEEVPEGSPVSTLSLTDNVNENPDVYVERIPFLSIQTKRDIRDFLYYISQSINFEKTILDANIGVEELGLKLNTKIKGKSNRVDERFNFFDVNTVLVKLNIDNILGELDLRYDYKANKDGIREVEKYIDLDYDENSPTQDKTLKLNANINPLKSADIFIKPKMYIDYSGVNNELQYLEVTPALSISPHKSLDIEFGVVSKNYKTNVRTTKRELFNEVSYLAPGLDEYEYFKEFNQGVERNIKTATITGETGINRLDGLPSGTLYGESLIDFAYNNVKNYFKEKNKKGILNILKDIEKNEGFALSAIGAISEIKEIANDKNFVSDITEYITMKFFEKINLNYEDRWHKFYPFTFIPKPLRGIIPGYERDYLGLDVPFFDINRAMESINQLSKEQNEHDPYVDEPSKHKDDTNNLLTTLESVDKGLDYDFIGPNGKKYKKVKRFSWVAYDFEHKLINPLIKFLEVDKYKEMFKDGVGISGVFSIIGKLTDTPNTFKPIYDIVRHNEEVKELDLLRGLFFYETEYQNKKNELLNKLKEVDYSISNGVVIKDDKESDGALYAGIKYRNDDYNIKFNVTTKIHQPEYTNSKMIEQPDRKTLEQVNNFNNIDIKLTMIEKDNHDLAKEFDNAGNLKLDSKGNPISRKEQIIDNGWFKKTYITKHYYGIIEEEYNSQKINANIDFSFNKYGINLIAGSNFDINKTKMNKVENFKVYNYNQGVLGIFSPYNKNIYFSNIQDKTPIYYKTYDLYNIEYTKLTVTHKLGISYHHIVNDNWELDYSLGWRGKNSYISSNKLTIYGEDPKFEIVKRDEDLNPLAKPTVEGEYKTGDSVIIKDETEYSLREKLGVKKALDGLLKEQVGIKSRWYEKVNEIYPSISVTYKPFKNIYFKNEIKLPILIKNGIFSGGMFGLESRVGIVW